MTDHSAMRLGLIREPQHILIPSMHTYAAMPPPPKEINWFGKIGAWPMLANDQIGDCIYAGCAHVIQQWTAYTDHDAVVMSDEEVISAYSTVTGYRPSDPSTDRGGLISDALRFWLMSGMPTPDGGPDVLTGAAAVRAQDQNDICRAVATFGNVLAGVELPISAQNEDVWTSTADAPGSWGGHCVPLVGYNEVGPICVTWGALKQMTWAWWLKYADQAYTLLSPDWMAATGTDPAGVDWAALETDMRRFATG